MQENPGTTKLQPQNESGDEPTNSTSSEVVSRGQMQPLKVLALLASRAGELVTREEIQQHVWGDRAFLDFEHGLNFCIRQVRSALNDDPAIEI